MSTSSEVGSPSVKATAVNIRDAAYGRLHVSSAGAAPRGGTQHRRADGLARAYATTPAAAGLRSRQLAQAAWHVPVADYKAAFPGLKSIPA